MHACLAIGIYTLMGAFLILYVITSKTASGPNGACVGNLCFSDDSLHPSVLSFKFPFSQACAATSMAVYIAAMIGMKVDIVF